jgi:hypothetical protein
MARLIQKLQWRTMINRIKKDFEGNNKTLISNCAG